MRFLVFAKKKVLRVLRTKGIVPPSTTHGTKTLAPTAMAPTLLGIETRGEGGGGCIQGPPPPPAFGSTPYFAEVAWCMAHEVTTRSLASYGVILTNEHPNYPSPVPI